MSKYFLKPKSVVANMKDQLDLSNYEDLKNVAGVDPLKFATNVDLANLKSDVDELDVDKLKNIPSDLNSLKTQVDKLDIGKLETTPVDLSKLSDVRKKEVVKKLHMMNYDELVKNIIRTTDTSNLLKKTDCNTKNSEIGEKITVHDNSDTYITSQ